MTSHMGRDKVLQATGGPAQTAPSAWIVYDGDCPFCARYVRFVRLRDTIGHVALVNARDGGALVDEIRAASSGENGVELRIEETGIEGEPWMVARVLRAPNALIDHTTLQCNVNGNSRTVSRTSRGNSASLKLPASGIHDGCTATARTRNGSVLFSARVEGRSTLMPSSSARRFEMPKYETRDDGEKAKKKKWPWIVAASAVVVAAGVTTGVLLSRRSKNEGGAQPGAVTVAW